MSNESLFCLCLCVRKNIKFYKVQCVLVTSLNSKFGSNEKGFNINTVPKECFYIEYTYLTCLNVIIKITS